MKNKKADTEARSKAGYGRVANTKPSHALEDYVGEYENPAYGILKIGLKDKELQFGFHKFSFPMKHFHYDRFDTPDDEEDGKHLEQITVIEKDPKILKAIKPLVQPLCEKPITWIEGGHVARDLRRRKRRSLMKTLSKLSKRFSNAIICR